MAGLKKLGDEYDDNDDDVDAGENITKILPLGILWQC